MMSRPRTRPTREQTRDRLLRAAAIVFGRKGIGDTSIEDICDEAGFSRGAFYSNFSAKDELVIELLDVHMASSSAEIDRLFAASADTAAFVANMESEQRERTGPLAENATGILHIELLLYALRNPANRPKLVAHQRRMRASNHRVLEQIIAAVGRDYPAPLDDVVTMVMALDSGLNLLEHIDPEAHRPMLFSQLMTMLHQMWLDSTPGESTS